MSTITFTAQTAAATDRVGWTRGFATGVVAAVVVTAIAGAFQAAGHPLGLVDGPIPLASFSQLVLLSTVVGILVARRTSRTTFYRVTVALTALSCVPDIAWGDGIVSKAGLILTHVVAAAIIVPRLARR
jgi:hypothetical protein